MFHHAALPSSNLEALDVLRKTEHAALWVRTDIQTAGRGRRGRSWVSPAGNLYATLGLKNPARETSASPQLCFVAAVALAHAVLQLAPPLAARLSLKWPNDVLLDGAKMAGILLEGEITPNGQQLIAMGMGVNLMNKPLLQDKKTASLSEALGAVTPDDLFTPLNQQMQHWLDVWGGGANFAAIRQAWLALAAGLGRPISITQGDGALTGTFIGLDETGKLVLESQNGQTHILSVGDVELS